MAMSEQRKDYLYSYQKEKLKRIPLDVPKEKYEEIKAAADAALLDAISTIDKAASKGVYHKNNASRKVSRLSKAVNSIA